jgi:hypothetical protein
MRPYSSQADSFFSFAQTVWMPARRNPRSLPPQPANNETADNLASFNRRLKEMRLAAIASDVQSRTISIGSGHRYAKMFVIAATKRCWASREEVSQMKSQSSGTCDSTQLQYQNCRLHPPHGPVLTLWQSEHG